MQSSDQNLEKKKIITQHDKNELIDFRCEKNSVQSINF